MILAEELFERFLQQNLGQYDHLQVKELKSACESQFELIKQCMGSPTLEEIRLQYLFTVRPSKYRVIKQLKNSYKGYKNKKITPKAFNYYVKMMLDYIRLNPSKFIKYEDTILQTTGLNPKDIQEKKYKTSSYWYAHNGHKCNS